MRDDMAGYDTGDMDQKTRFNNTFTSFHDTVIVAICDQGNNCQVKEMAMKSILKGHIYFFIEIWIIFFIHSL